MKNTFDPEKHLDTLAQSMGLAIDDSWRDTVLAHLVNAEKMADILYSAPLSDTELHLANTFDPGCSKANADEVTE